MASMLMLDHGWIDREGKAMRKFHVILSDDDGGEFDLERKALDRDDAWDTVQMDYPAFLVVDVVEIKPYAREV